MPRSVRLLLVSVLLAACGGDKATGPVAPAVVPVNAVIIAPDTVRLTVGESSTINAVALAASGGALADRTLAWRTSAPGVATVSNTGRVTAVGAGVATITAEAEGRSASSTAVVAAAADYFVDGVQFTQGVQDSDGSVPLIRNGGAAAVNVLLRSSSTVVPTMELVLRLTDESGAPVYVDTARTIASTGTVATFSAPSAQFLVPPTAIRAGVRWQILRDPRHVQPDANGANDTYPSAAPAPLASVDVPPLNIRFVPIVLASDGNAQPTITQADLAGYLRTLRSIAPVGVVNVTIGTPFVTTASFGTAPRGGASTFWTQLLRELDAARVAHPTESGSNWYGVVSPPPAFNFTGYGGFSYVSSTALGAPVSRTSLGVRTNWFSRPTQARDLVAHELGHAFGRIHTSCGGADLPNDASYPVLGGTLDFVGHDVYAWANGLATRATTVDVSNGDVMGYCFPAWSSVYTYLQILTYRARIAPLAILAAAAGEAPEHVLEIRGSLDRGTGIEGVAALSERATIESTRAVDMPAMAVRAASMASGVASRTYRAEGIARDGRVLFAESFEPMDIDHAPLLRHFAITVRSTPALERDLVSVRIVSPVGVSSLAGVRAR